ncbi:MAG: hypothetical protein RR700_06640, partial [Anaerorhabdus sp.]
YETITAEQIDRVIKGLPINESLPKTEVKVDDANVDAPVVKKTTRKRKPKAEQDQLPLEEPKPVEQKQDENPSLDEINENDSVEEEIETKTPKI